MLCDYGCGKEAKYQFKNGKWCCENNWKRCLAVKPRISGENSPRYGKNHTEETLNKMRSKIVSEETRKKIGEKSKGRKQPDRCKKAQSKRMKEWLSNHANSFPVKGYKNNKDWMINEGSTYLNSKPRDPEKMNISKEIRRQKMLSGYSDYLNSLLRDPKKVKINREKQRDYMLNGGANIAIRGMKNPSTNEIKLRELVHQIFPNSEYQYEVLNYSLDIAIPIYKIAIEYDGYYHFDCQEHIDYHKKRQEEIEEQGWKFIRYNIFNKFPRIEQIKEDIFKIIKE